MLLSQLSPELGKYPEALSAMGDCIQTTSKLMGGDGVAALQALTTAMNQYDVSSCWGYSRIKGKISKINKILFE